MIVLEHIVILPVVQYSPGFTALACAGSSLLTWVLCNASLKNSKCTEKEKND